MLQCIPRNAFSYYGGACRDSFTRIGLVEKFSSLAVEKEELTFFVLRCLVTIPRPLREGVNVLGWLVTFPHPLREREQSCLSRAAKATNAGVGVAQEHLQSAPLCSRKLFSDTLSLCSRYRFENLSCASFRLNLTSLTSPRPLREGVNVLGWLVTIPHPLREREQSCSSRHAKATNAGVGLKTIIHEYPPTVSDHFPLKGGRCLRLQSTSFVFPCPLGGSGQIHPTYCVILSPASIHVRRIFKTLQKGDSSGFRPQNDGTLVSLASPLPPTKGEGW